MIITWNKSTDNDFDHYELLLSESEEGDKTLISEVSEINDTTYVLTEFDPTQPIWYWVRVFGLYGYSSDGSGYYVLDDNPTSAELYPITYQDGSFTIVWSQNNDDDFGTYTLYESLSSDMSSGTSIYETDERADTTYVVTGFGEEEIRYYQVVLEDLWGLESESNIQYAESNPLIGTYKSILHLVQPNDTCYTYRSYPDSFWLFQLTMNTYQEYYWSYNDECWQKLVWSFEINYEYNMFYTNMFISSDGDTLLFEFGWELKGDSLFWYYIHTWDGWDTTYQCNGDYWDPALVPYIIALRDDVNDFTPLCDTTSQSMIISRKNWIDRTIWNEDGNRK